MTLDERKTLVTAIEPELAGRPFVRLHTFERDGHPLHLALTERLRRETKRGRVWKAPPFLTALKNAAYGFDGAKARSLGGADGVFLLDRAFTPKNEMMRKLFDRYLDRPEGGARELAAALGVGLERLLPVRVVSHHLRLLGVLHRGQGADWLVLVDYDDEAP
jgi:hypothetical protein